MSLIRKNKQRKKRRALRVRNALRQSTLPRVSVFRSAKHIYAQLIDDAQQHTVVSSSSAHVQASGDKKASAYEVGKQLAERARAAGVERAKFDRGSFLFHGRVKALAQGLRDGGIQV